MFKAILIEKDDSGYRAGLKEIDEAGGMTEAIAEGIPKLRIEESAARTQARIDSGKQTVVGVNSYKPENDSIVNVLKIDNNEVRNAQLAKLERLKAERDEAAVQQTLEHLTNAARSGEGNLLDLGIKAARAHATVGEISYALEKEYGRHSAEIKSIGGAWTGFGVWMSATQMEDNRASGDAYWLYVVEHANDPDAATLHRIQNPAGQATKFGFDAGWQAIREPDLELDEAANPITRNTRRLLGWNSTAD